MPRPRTNLAQSAAVDPAEILAQCATPMARLDADLVLAWLNPALAEALGIGLVRGAGTALAALDPGGSGIVDAARRAHSAQQVVVLRQVGIRRSSGSDLVGRNVTFHEYSASVGTFADPINAWAGGGYVSALQRVAGYFFDHDVKIADRKGRKEMKPQVAKTRGDRVFKGDLVVLIDSRSASAAEIFARLIQIEKRGTVLGDQSAGKVMESRFFPHKSGIDVVAFWGLSITDADVIMTDGKSLEKTGVTADELSLPTANDLAAKRDPTLARLAALSFFQLLACRWRVLARRVPMVWPCRSIARSPLLPSGQRAAVLCGPRG